MSLTSLVLTGTCLTTMAQGNIPVILVPSARIASEPRSFCLASLMSTCTTQFGTSPSKTLTPGGSTKPIAIKLVGEILLCLRLVKT